MKKIMLLLLIALVLCGCTKAEYNYPDDITYNENNYLVSWSSVPKAISYEIMINKNRFETTDLFYDMSNYETGVYEVKVRSKYKDKYSLFSYPIEVKIIKDIEINVTLEEDILTFSSLTPNIKYTIKSYNYLGELENTINLQGTTYEVSSNLGFNHYEVEGFLDSLSVFKKTIYVNVDGYSFFRGESLLKINDIKGDKVYINDSLLNNGSYSISENDLSIYKDYLDTLELGSYLLKVDGEKLYLTYLKISETQKPKLTSASEVTYSGNDVMYTFEMYGGTFIGVYSTPNISNDNYSFVDGVLTIRKEFIDLIKSNEPTRKQIFFQYEIVNRELTVIGYLSIRLVD